jgi:SGNH domain (fused to AT3 domains)
VGDVCALAPMPGQLGMLGCQFGAPTGARTVVLYGDSHAQALSASLDRHFKQAGIRGIKVELNGCQVVPTIVDTKDLVGTAAACQVKMQTLVAFLREQRADVVVASRWSFRLYPVAGEIVDMPSRNSEGGLEREAYREYAVESSGSRRMDGPAKRAALQGMVRDLLGSGRRVVLVYPIPELSWNIAALNYRHYSAQGTPLPEISIPAEDYRRRNRFVLEAFDALASEPKLSPVRPERLFCDSLLPGRCAGQVGGRPLYFDDDHLSDAGADLVITHIIAALNAEP